MNFEREVNSRMERNKSQLGKRSAKSNYRPPQISKFNQRNKTSMLNKEEHEDHVKKSLCFRCHKPGHWSFKCPTTKKKVAALEVEQDDDDGSDDEPTKEVVPSISTAIMHMKVEEEPTVLQIKECFEWSAV